MSRALAALAAAALLASCGAETATPPPPRGPQPIENFGPAPVPMVAWSGARADTFVLEPGYFTVAFYDSFQVLGGPAAARAAQIDSLQTARADALHRWLAEHTER